MCGALLVVVRGPSEEVQIACGGAPMVEDDGLGVDAAALDPSPGDGPALGKRYDLGIELLCSKAGEGALTTAGRVLSMKGAKPLPSSD